MARAAGPKLRRQHDEGVPPSNTVNNEPEAPMDDFVGSPSTEYRERVERARGEARERYRGDLAAVFDLNLSISQIDEVPDKGRDRS